MGRVIYIVDDEAVIRASMASLLAARGDVETCEIESGAELLGMLDDLRPGCVVLDLRLDGAGGSVSGVAVLEALAQRRPDCPVIVVTGAGDIAAAVMAFDAGAMDFLYKPYEVKPLMAAIDRALYRLEHGEEDPQTREAARAAMARLSPAEAGLLDRLIRGDTHRQIGEALALDEHGVRVLRAQMLETLGAASLLCAVRAAMIASVPLSSS